MNLLLISPDAMLDNQRARICGRQVEHIHQTLKLKLGDTLTVGLENAQRGRATLTKLTATEAELDVEWLAQAPAALPLTLFLALPRPKMLKRIKIGRAHV